MLSHQQKQDKDWQLCLKKMLLLLQAQTFSSEVVIATLLAMNLFGFIKANANGLIEGYGSGYSVSGRILVYICIFSSSIMRIMSMTFYFVPALGLFDSMHHYQGILPL